MEVRGATSHTLIEIQRTRSNRDEMTAGTQYKDLGEKEQREHHSFSRETIEQQVDGVNELLDGNGTAIKFNLHEDLGRMYVQIVSRDTNEIIKEIPPEKFLDLVASMLKHAGLLIDKKI